MALRGKETGSPRLKLLQRKTKFPTPENERLCYLAVIANKPLHLKRLLAKGANPNGSYRKTSLLIRAIQYNRFEIVKILINFKAKIRKSLIWAVKCGRYKIARWLLGLGRITLKQKLVSLQIAIERKDWQMIKIFPIIPKNTSMLTAIGDNDYEMVHFLLKNGADPNCELTKPLIEAIHKNDPDMVDLLIKFKADVNRLFSGNESLLQIAVRRGCSKIAEKLLQANAGPKVMTFQGYTTFEYICRYCDVNMLKLFMKYEFLGPTGIVFATMNYDPEPLRYLLDNFLDLDVHIQDQNEFPAFYAASRNYKCENLLSILEFGADINLADKFGSYPILRSRGCLRHDCPVRQHFLKLSLLGYKVNQVTLRSSPLLANMEETGAADLIEFKQEVERMKNIVISSYPKKTVFEVLLMKLRQVTKFAGNEILADIYERNDRDFKREFPNFGFLLNLNFRKGVRRRILMSKARGCLIRYGVDEMLEEGILEYLSNEELKIIVGDQIQTKYKSM